VGSACALVGRRVALGLDTNSNGTLDASEVTSSDPLCSTATVTAGGSDASLALVDEARGATCASAGKKITTTSGGTSTDSYLCYTAPGLPFTWKRITAAAANLAANFGHVIASVTSGPVSLTLPVEPGIKVNDTITVRGESANAWTIAQNAGQTIGTRKLGSGTEPGALWTPQDDPAVQNWWFVASSANGMRLAAVANSSDAFRVAGSQRTGAIWTSGDAGKTWNENVASGPQPWASVASSADGTKLAAVGIDTKIWTSSDSGASWQQYENNRFWVSVTISADGSHMAAVVLEADNIGIGKPAGQGKIYTWEQTGTNAFGAGPWVARATSRNWRSIASSETGQNMVAVAYTDESSAGPRPLEPLSTSTDFGVTWTPSIQTFESGYRVASSQDGKKLIMAERFGKVYTSTDSGLNWVASPGLDKGFYAVASSADGSTLLAVAPNDTTNSGVVRDGVLRVSTDSGATWTPRASTGLWRGAAMSADGNLLFAAINNGVIYRSIGNRTTLGTAGSITGGQTNDITLRYLGDGLFDATSANGPAFTTR
jgi:hypothetical protein